MSTMMIEHQKARTIVEQVTQARTEVRRAFGLLQDAKTRLATVLGTASYGNSLWERSISDYNLERTAQETDTYLERNAWRYILTQTGMTSFMTPARQKALQEQLDKGQFPVLTVENILSTLEGLTGQLGTLLQESAKEVFDWLRPSPHSRVGQLKTNQYWQIGHKVILSYAVEAQYSSGYRLNYHRTSHFQALGNVLSLLDGQGVPQYPHDLCTQLNEGLKTCTSGDEVTTPYLRLKPYRNGNAHLVFTQPDLVDRLNQLGGDGSLHPAERPTSA